MKKSMFFCSSHVARREHWSWAHASNPLNQRPNQPKKLLRQNLQWKKLRKLSVTEKKAEEPVAELGPVLKIGQIGMMSGSDGSLWHAARAWFPIGFGVYGQRQL
jgi:hypothetical protein